MSSLIFLPFLASSGLPAAPPSPPSEGLVGLVSFFFCSAIALSVVQWTCRCHRPRPILTDGRSQYSFSSPPEVLAQGQGLVLVGGVQAHPVEVLRSAGQPLKENFEESLPIVDSERHLPCPYFHHNFGAKHSAVTVAEAGI